MLVLQESLSVGNVEVQMRDNAIELALGLINRFAHLCGDNARKLLLALGEGMRKICHSLEALGKVILVRIVESESLIRGLNVLLECCAADSLIRLQQLVILGVH